jgi:asparagine synthase (glutamine-hydrolysing)
MCGINGIFNFSNNQIGNQLSNINLMNEKIRHRGPDGNGTWYDHDHSIYLGHQRLSIIDLSDNARQPMASNNQNILTYNGEIFNYNELKNNLKSYKFNSTSDTELLIAMYDRYKDKCLNYFNGQFSFGIWDNSEKLLFLARDRVGIKPLYYTNVNSIFVFSSEIRSILALPWIKAELNKNELYHYLTYNYTTPPNTLFKGIYKFHPGYKMIVNAYGIKSYEPYWNPKNDFSIKTEEEQIDEINEAFEKSVKYRMVSDVPIGTFISGGVDSSAVLANMSKNTSNSINTFSVGFENSPEFDELQYANRISKLFNTNHHEVIVKPNDFKELISNISEVFDDPLADPTSIPIYFLTKLAKQTQTKVILTGDGPDELFIGYRRWMKLVNLKKYYDSLGFPLLKSIVKIHNILNVNNKNSPILEFLNRAEHNQEYFWGSIGGIKESSKPSFLGSEYNQYSHDLNSHSIINNFRKEFNKTSSNSLIDWMSFIGLRHVIPNYYMHRADRLGLVNSIELRVPFLDHNFINVALSCPSSLKVKNNEPKYILKKSLEKIIPPDILYRKKMGFCVPLEKWGSEILNDYIEKNLNQFCNNTGLLNSQHILKQLDNPNNIFMLWNIYFLLNWHDRWID